MVAATTSGLSIPATCSARRIVGPSASRCARDAISGTTPPNRACSSTLEATSSASSVTGTVVAEFGDADSGFVAGTLDGEDDHRRSRFMV